MSKASDPTANAKDKVKETIHEGYDKEATHEVGDKAKEAGHNLKEKAKEAGHDVDEKVKRTGQKVREAAK